MPDAPSTAYNPPMTDGKQSSKAGILVVIILLLIGVVLALVSKITHDAQDVPGAQGKAR